MKISVITINYNNKVGLEETIRSVCGQTENDLEYIIIDGGSVDGSVELIRKYESELTYWVSEKDEGIYDAMNKGIRKATGDYLVFMNSGDCFHKKEVTSILKGYVTEFPEVDIFYGDIIVINDKGRGYDWVNKHPEKLNLAYFKTSVINHQASLVKADLFRQFGLFPLKYKLAADYWLWIESLIHNKAFKHIDAILVKYDNGGVSGTGFSTYLEEMERIWDDCVPGVVSELVDEINYYKKLAEYKIVKAAIAFNEKYQGLKNRR